MSRKRRLWKTWVAAGVLLGGCAGGANETAGAGLLMLVEPRAQAWSRLEACLQDRPGQEAVCVSVRTVPSDGGDSFGPSRLAEVELRLRPGMTGVRWTGADVEGMDDPVLHLTMIRPSWQAGQAPMKEDFVEVSVPFGFIRNREPCGVDLSVKELSDEAIFTAWFDGRRQVQIEPAACRDDDANGG